jgi:hypothetical protein
VTYRQMKMRGLRNVLILFAGGIAAMVWYANLSKPYVFALGMAAVGLMASSSGIMIYFRPGPTSLRKKGLVMGVAGTVSSGLFVCYAVWPSKILLELAQTTLLVFFWRGWVYFKEFGGRAVEQHRANPNRD